MVMSALLFDTLRAGYLGLPVAAGPDHPGQMWERRHQLCLRWQRKFRSSPRCLSSFFPRVLADLRGRGRISCSPWRALGDVRSPYYWHSRCWRRWESMLFPGPRLFAGAGMFFFPAYILLLPGLLIDTLTARPSWSLWRSKKSMNVVHTHSSDQKRSSWSTLASKCWEVTSVKPCSKPIFQIQGSLGFPGVRSTDHFLTHQIVQIAPYGSVTKAIVSPRKISKNLRQWSHAIGWI